MIAALRERKSHIFAREAFNHYVEEKWCGERLFDVEKFDGAILDPCCGWGRIVSAARERGLVAMGHDIVDRGFSNTVKRDFLEPAFPWSFPNIVSNPPFENFRAFAERALERASGKVALIWLVRTLPAARWLQGTPLKKIYFLTPRPSMPTGEFIAKGGKVGGGTQDFCWLVWDRNAKSEAPGWLHRDGPIL